MSGPVLSQGATPPVPDTSLWQWDTSGPLPIVTGFPVSDGTGKFTPTKTGLTPADLQNYVGIPIVFYNTQPPTPVPNETLQEWIRWAEDKVEQETSILLCQTWVASQPAFTPQIVNALGLVVNNPTGGQIRGFDYDLEDSSYDFHFQRWQDEGWGYQTLRYRPVQSMTYNSPASGIPSAAISGVTAVKNTAFIYPLLSVYFRMPSNWNVEDRDFGLIRYVPATNVQMLPLFAMQLAFMGFSESVPGAMWLQYTAGLTAYDYKTRYSFMRELVLAAAALTALNSIQSTISMGLEGTQLAVDGLMFRSNFNKDGPLGPFIMQFTKRYDQLLKIAQSKVSGPMINVL